jgi:ATP-dependent RNA helicase DeaD
VPQDIEYYVHRIGRTGRAGKTGKSFTFVSGREIFKIREIERICRTTIEEMQMPTTRKVMRSKALKTLDRVLVYKDHEDTALMKKFIEKKM